MICKIQDVSRIRRESIDSQMRDFSRLIGIVSPFKSVFTNGEIFDSKNKDSRMRDVSRLIVRSLTNATYVLYLQIIVKSITYRQETSI